MRKSIFLINVILLSTKQVKLENIDIFIDKRLSLQLGISAKYYDLMRKTMTDFLMACNKDSQGLAIAGIDFAIGRVGGKFGETVLLGMLIYLAISLSISMAMNIYNNSVKLKER